MINVLIEDNKQANEQIKNNINVSDNEQIIKENDIQLKSLEYIVINLISALNLLETMKSVDSIFKHRAPSPSPSPSTSPSP